MLVGTGIPTIFVGTGISIMPAGLVVPKLRVGTGIPIMLEGMAAELSIVCRLNLPDYGRP